MHYAPFHQCSARARFDYYQPFNVRGAIKKRSQKVEKVHNFLGGDGSLISNSKDSSENSPDPPIIEKSIFKPEFYRFQVGNKNSKRFFLRKFNFFMIPLPNKLKVF